MNDPLAAGVPRAARRRWQYVVAATVSFAGVALSVTVFLALARQTREHIHADFERASHNVFFALNRTVGTDCLEMRSLRSLYDSSNEVDRREFASYVSPLIEAQASVRAFQWAPRVAASDRRNHEDAAASDGLARYSIADDRPGGRAPAAIRDEYYPVLFAEPAEDAASLLGLDLATNPACRAAMERSRDTGELAATASLRLDGETAEQTGPRLFLAVYRRGVPLKTVAERQRNLLGFVVGVLQVGDMVEESMAGISPFGADVRITDRTDPKQDDVLYLYRSHLRAKDANLQDVAIDGPTGIRQTDTLDVAGRQWTVECAAIPEFVAARTTWYPWAAGLAGLAVTGLLATYLVGAAMRNARTLRLAEQLAESNQLLKRESDERLRVERTLQTNQAKYKTIYDSSKDAIMLWTPGEGFFSGNRACVSLFGCKDESEFVSCSPATLSPEYQPDGTLSSIKAERMMSIALEEGSHFFEWKHTRRDGTEFFATVLLTRVEFEGKRFLQATVRDITQQKRAEEALRISERKLHGVLNQTFQFIGQLTPDGTLIDVNRTALALAGVEEESVLNRPFWDTPWWSHSAELQDRLRQAVTQAAHGEFVRMEATHPASDGTLHWVDFSLKPVVDDSGKVAFLIAEGHDITDRKAAEQHQTLVLRRLEGVNALQEDLLLPAPIEEKLEKITEAAVPLLDLDFCRIWMVRPCEPGDKGCPHENAPDECHRCRYHDKCLHLLASSGRYTHIDGGHRRVPFGAYKIGRIAGGEEGRFLTNQVTTDPRVHDHEWAKELGLVSFAGYKLRDANGEPIGVLAAFAKHPFSEEDDAMMASLAETTSRFILDEKAAEALRVSERRHRLFAENVSDVIWTMDFNGRFTYISPSVRQLTGLSPEEYQSHGMDEMMLPASASKAHKALDELIAAVESGQPTVPGTLEIEIFRKDGSTVWTEISFSGMVDESGRLVAVQGVTRDLTSRRQMEEALRQAKLAAEEANAAKSRFLASMSHEIRTPMTAILGYADLLLDPNLTTENRSAYAATIRRSGEHLLLIINDILDLSRIEAGKMSLDIGRCNVVSLLADVASIVRPRAEQHGVSFLVEYPTEIPETIRTDGARLRQAIINLAGNAVKFTERGSVTIRASFVREWQCNQPALRLEVVDTGIGIREDVLPKLFQPFAQGDSSIAVKFGGTGLGLAISRHIAQMLGGELTAASALGKGSTFTMTIPTDSLEGVHMLQRPAEVEHETPQHAWPSTLEDLTGLRILLAEDGYDNRELIRTILHKTGADVEIAENGRIAVEKAEAEAFDLILMDMNMPEMNGYEATRTLRDRGFRQPILALTANAMSGDCEQCLAAGCNEFLAKPIDRAQLVQTIATYLGRWKPNDQPAPPAEDETARADEAIISQFIDDPDMAEILEGFVGRLDAQLDAMRLALADGEHEELRSLAHKLKGAGGSYGYPSLTEACRALEEAAKAKDAEAASKALDAVAALVRAVVRGYAPSLSAGQNA